MSGRATSFYYSFLVLPADKRHAIIAVWDFCRAVDDAVDEPGDRDPGSALEPVARRSSRACTRGASRATPQGQRLLPFIAQFTLPRSAFEDLIDGVAMDLQRSRYETFDELRQYCLRVASAVGLICVEIFGYRDLQTRDYAIDLGIALQLTNIIRDVAPDLERGPRVHSHRGSAAFRLHRGGLAGRGGDRQRSAAARVSSRARAAILSESRGRAAAPRRAAAGGRADHGRDLLRAAARDRARAATTCSAGACASRARGRR